MLGAAVPATASTHTSTSSATPTSPTRPSRLRGLSYLRNHLHSHPTPAKAEAPPPLTRSTSSPNSPQASRVNISEGASGIQNGESGWLPTVHSPQLTSTSTQSAAPEPSTRRTIMTRSRVASALGPTPTNAIRRQSTGTETEPLPSASMPATSASGTQPAKDAMPTVRFIPHIETRSTRPSLHFTTMSRTLRTATGVVRVGRYSERDNNNAIAAQYPTNSTAQDFLPVGFKSKVVSRRHCEFWCTAGQWYIKDVKSSSGTFLNHVRLSPPGQESRPYEVNDGDTVQLGIDFKGGEEVIFRCVKIRIECNRGWQKSLNAYNTTAHKRLLKNAGVLKRKGARDSDAASVNSSSECSICLNPVAPCQALFVAPCSHVWHYQCVRNLIHGPHYPNFLCPNCRFMADLEADIEPPEEMEDEMGGLGVDGEGQQPPSQSSDEDPVASTRPEDGINYTDEQLAWLLQNSSLQSTPQPSTHGISGGKPHLLNSHTPVAPLNQSKNHSTSTRPVAISPPPLDRRSTSATDLLLGASAFSTTPTSNVQFALASGVAMGDGPMTPRNDAGPFVLDGSAGRSGMVGASEHGGAHGVGILDRVVAGGDEEAGEGVDRERR
ncbi:hypothetical protein LTR48_000106 [Friedmanniomyces endolithicus]|uniref:RING-type E3 ubiquitin transferase n=1 Tax=Rachicladosporium monterosium TaxID=1507873 RepID=A0ABR0LAY8_9PEZI|nr:hypothetical protein LTR48_000106 [Friedmanniomyces endolithicus]KAK5146153.1 hypothetical protein LTR32_002227 [Rachicladosporium monterosium]